MLEIIALKGFYAHLRLCQNSSQSCATESVFIKNCARTEKNVFMLAIASDLQA